MASYGQHPGTEARARCTCFIKIESSSTAGIAADMDERSQWHSSSQPQQTGFTDPIVPAALNVTWMAVGNASDGSIQEYIFDQHATELVETAWHAAMHSADEDAQGMLLPSRFSTYTLDFRAMTQTNVETNTVRQLHRYGPAQDSMSHHRLLSLDEAEVEAFDHEPHLPIPSQRKASRQIPAATADDGTDAAIAAALGGLDASDLGCSNDSTGPCTEPGSDSENHGHWVSYDSEDGSDITEMNINRRTGAAIGSTIFLDSNHLDASSTAQNPSAAVTAISECVICLNSIRPSELLALPCIHVFHRSCIREWLATSRICPLCKSAVDSGFS